MYTGLSEKGDCEINDPMIEIAGGRYRRLENNMTKSILLVGVGGQGTILASKLLTIGLMEAGYDVKMSEIHGMSQRGGSVSSQIRYGEKVESPVIDQKGADVLIAFEKMEALRWSDYVKDEGTIVVNQAEIPPMSVVAGQETYDPDIIKKLETIASTRVLDATKLASELGNPKAANVVLLGSMIARMQLNDIDWDQILRNNVKEAFVELNLKALKVGMEAVK